MVVPREAEVHTGHRAACDGGAGRVQVAGDARRARDAVGRAQGQQAERGLTVSHLVHDGADRAVATAQDDQVAAPIEGHTDRLGQPRRGVQGVHGHDRDAGLSQEVTRLGDIPRALARVFTISAARWKG